VTPDSDAIDGPSVVDPQKKGGKSLRLENSKGQKFPGDLVQRPNHRPTNDRKMWGRKGKTLSWPWGDQVIINRWGEGQTQKKGEGGCTA